MNIFIEGLQGAGKSTLLRSLSERLNGYFPMHEGDYSPVELAWCAYLSESQYADVLAKYPQLVIDIQNNTIQEDDHYIVCYTKIITDEPGFHKYMEQYEIYNGNLDAAAFEQVILTRYSKWNGTNQIFECSIFQNIIENQMLYLCMSDEQILDFYKRLHDVLSGKDYQIIYLDSDSINDNIQIIRKERSDNNGNEMWFPMMISYIEASPYGKTHALKGLDGLLTHLERRKKIEHSIIESFFKDNTLIVMSKNYSLDDVIIH